MRNTEKKKKIVKFPSNKEKNDKKPSMKPILSLLIGAVLLILLISSMRNFIITRFIDVQTVVEEQHNYVEEGLPATIVRQERLIKAPISGDITKEVEEGSRVKKGQKVISYQNSDMSENNWKSIEKIERDIDRLTRDFLEDLYTLRDTSIANTEAGEKAQKLREGVDKLAQVSSEQENDSSEDEYNEDEIVTAPDPGIVSFYVDGFEDKIMDFNQLSPERMQHYRNIYSGKFDTTNEVVTRSPLFKLVEDFTWRVVIEIPDQNFNLTELNSLDVDFEFSDTEFITGEIKDISKFDSCYLAVVEFNQEINDYWHQRFTNVDVVIDTDTGFIIPESALVTKNEDKGVYQVKRGVVTYSSVEVLTELENEQVLVTGLDDGDLIITNTFLVREGDRVR